MTQCKWGPCSRQAKYSPAGINLCEHHLNQLLEGVHRLHQGDAAIRWVLTPVRPKPVLEPSVQERTERKPRQRVYFMERDGRVKIGISNDVSKRVREVSRGSAMVQGMTVGPVTLLGTMPGGRAMESKLHQRFRHLRVGGEWFTMTDEIQTYIDSNAKKDA